MIRVLGVDDHPLMMAGIAGAIDAASELAAHVGESPITPRELLVLRGIAEGASNRRIGAKLDITEHTVKGQLKNILAKLDANDRAHAVVIALKRGILDL